MVPLRQTRYVQQPVVKLRLHSAGDHPRSTPPRRKTRGGGPGLTALLLPQIFPIFSVVAPLRRGPHGADCAPWGGSSGRLAALGATPDFHHGLLRRSLLRVPLSPAWISSFTLLRHDASAETRRDQSLNRTGLTQDRVHECSSGLPPPFRSARSGGFRTG